MGLKFVAALAGVPLACIALSAHGQAANAGDIRGTATDTSGALLPDVTVTITNTTTNVQKVLTTNKDGLYDTGPIVTGNYTVTFSKDGFATFNRTGLNLDVQTVTVDGALKVGGSAEQVTVNTDVPLIETETGEQSETLQFENLVQLPNVGGNGPSWENFTSLIAGAAGTPSGAQGVNNPGQSVSVNGNLPYSSVLSDGAESTLPSSSNADTYVFETVQEVKVSTSAFSAQYGVGGILFNQISKGGTNSWHGAAYEYNQNDAYNARPYNFQPGTINKNRVRFNNFGGSIGGPVLKDKAFFYFNYDQITNNSAVSGYATVPTTQQRNGDFTQSLIPGITCAATTPGAASSPGCIYDPNSTRVVNGQIGRTPFAGNLIPQARFDGVAKNIQGFFPAPNRPGNITAASFNNNNYVPFSDTNNYFYQGTQSNPFKKYFGRLDFNIGAKNRLTMTVAKRDNPAFTINQNICPVNCFAGDVDSYNAQITDVHSFSGRTINEVRLGYTNQLNFFVGNSFGGGYPAKLGFQYAKADGFPNIGFNGFLGLGPGINAIYKEHVFDPSDVVTLIRGRHILHFGGEFLIKQDNSTAWGNLDPGSFGFTGDYTKGSLGDKNSGLDYADFLLGTAHNWSARAQPEYAGRQKTPQVFIQDDFKLRPNLTLNLGLRYQVQLGWTDAKNDQATFDPTITNSKTNTPGAIWFAANKTNGRTSLQQNKYAIVLPRVGFAYTPQPNTVFRGGIGLYSYDWSLDQYGQGQGAAINNTGNANDNTNGTAYVTTLNGTGANLPFGPTSTDPTSRNGQDFNYVPYNTPVARILQYNFSMERQLGSNFALQMAYVGSHGYNLVFPSSINQLTVANLGKGAAFRPFPQFNDLNGYQVGAISNYNSLQVSATKRLSHGFSFDTNYVWSKFLDDIDSSGWGSRGGTQSYQNAYDFHANYGPSNFDIRNAWKGSVIYNLPFGIGQQFLNSNHLLDAIIGGWRASSTFQVQGGNPFTPTINGGLVSNFSLAGQNFRLRPNLVGNPTPANRTLLAYFNTAAYATPAANTFGNVHRNSLYGPGYESFNASLGKTFHYNERIGLSIRADVNNILNHPTFGVPNTDTTNGGGQITSTSNQSRNMQLSARFAF